MQSYNTNATSWALAGYLYKIGGTYELVPFGLLVGASLVVMHRIFYKVQLSHFNFYKAHADLS